MKRYTNLIAFDDAPFPHHQAGTVKIVGTVYANQRLDGVLIGEVTKDGDDASDEIIRLVGESKFAQHVQLIMLQGITLAGFNVVDVFKLNEQLHVPILIVSRRQPDMKATRQALLEKISNGAQKWAIIERLGAMRQFDHVYTQSVGLKAEEIAATIRQFTQHGHIPEPIRVAHLIAGALAQGISQGRA